MKVRKADNTDYTMPIVVIGLIVAAIGLAIACTHETAARWAVPVLAAASVTLITLVVIHVLDRRRLADKWSGVDALFRILRDHAPDVYVLHSADWRILDVNHIASERLGYTRDELLSMSVLDIEVEHTRERLDGILSNARSDKAISLRGRHRRKDGTTFPVEVRVSRCEVDSCAAFLTTVRDLTGDVEAHKLFEYKESVLARASRLAKVGGWEFDANTRVGSWTDEVALLHDLEPSTSIAVVDVMQYYIGEGRTALERAIRQILETGEPYDLEVDLITAKGRHKRMHTVAEAVRENDRIVCIRGVCQDVTERWMAETRIRDLIDRVSMATKAGRVGIWDFNPRTGTFLCNDVAFELFGRPAGSSMLRESEWLDCVHPEDRDRVVKERTAAEESGVGYSTEYRIVLPDGSLRHMKNEATVFRDADGHPDRILGCVIDVTSYRTALEEREQAKLRAEEASAVKSRFLAVMSHELRTPLNAIIGFSELMVMGDLPSRERESASIIASAGKKLLHIVEDVLDLSKIEAGRIRVQYADFDLLEVLYDIVSQFRLEAEEKGLLLTVKQADDLPGHISGDAGLLRVVLANLIANAIKFTGHGEVTVTAGLVPGHSEDGTIELVFHVDDTGIGIRPENQERIFSMFEQEEDNLTRRYDGAGIGLTISRELVTLMGGRIWLHSVPDQGSRFSFTVRFDPVAAMASGESDPGSRAEETTPIVLVVEDDIFSRTLLMRLLEQNGYRAKATGDGTVALDWLRHGVFDAVLLDIQLPSLSGIEVTRRIRRGDVAGCRMNLPIIAISAYSSPADRTTCLAEGLDGFLAKPVDLLAVLATLRQFLRTPPSVEAQAGAPPVTALNHAKPGPRWTKLAAPDL